MKRKKLTRFFLVLIIFILLSNTRFGIFAVSETNDDITIEQAVELLKGWEHIFHMLFDENDSHEYMLLDKEENCNIEKRIGNTVEYESEYFNYIVPFYLESYSSCLSFLNKTYTLEMSKRIITCSRFLIKDEKVYYPKGFLDSHYPIAVTGEVYGDIIKIPIEDRITLHKSEDGKVIIEFRYWEAKNDYLDYGDFPESALKEGKLIAEKTENGYRICDFDDILIIEDSMAESGYRKYRFTNTIPETSDAAVIAVCALGLTAAVSVVLLLKKKG